MPDDAPSHEVCPFCREGGDLHCTRHNGMVVHYAIWCSNCGANGPYAPDCPSAWEAWDKR